MDAEPTNVTEPTEVRQRVYLVTRNADGSAGELAPFERFPDGAWRRVSPPLPNDDPDTAASRPAKPPVEHIYVGTDEINGLHTPAELQPLFDGRDVDDDTRILAERYSKIDGVPVLHELWVWDGVTASSLVIPKQYLPSLAEADVLALLRQEFEVTGGYTFVNHADSHFVYVNYNFVAGD